MKTYLLADAEEGLAVVTADLTREVVYALDCVRVNARPLTDPPGWPGYAAATLTQATLAVISRGASATLDHVSDVAPWEPYHVSAVALTLMLDLAMTQAQTPGARQLLREFRYIVAAPILLSPPGEWRAVWLSPLPSGETLQDVLNWRPPSLPNYLGT